MQDKGASGGTASGGNKLREYTQVLDRNLDLILAELDKKRGSGASSSCSSGTAARSSGTSASGSISETATSGSGQSAPEQQPLATMEESSEADD